MSERTDVLFLELFDSVETECASLETVLIAVREAAGGVWHGNEYEHGWVTCLDVVLVILEKKGLLKDE